MSPSPNLAGRCREIVYFFLQLDRFFFRFMVSYDSEHYFSLKEHLQVFFPKVLSDEVFSYLYHIFAIDECEDMSDPDSKTYAFVEITDIAFDGQYEGWWLQSRVRSGSFVENVGDNNDNILGTSIVEPTTRISPLKDIEFLSGGKLRKFGSWSSSLSYNSKWTFYYLERPELYQKIYYRQFTGPFSTHEYHISGRGDGLVITTHK